jgi:hypothetical protein
MIRNKFIISLRENRLGEYKILGQLLSRPLVSVSTHVGMPELKNLELVELLEERDLAIDHIPSAFVDVLLFAHKIGNVILVFRNSNETSFGEHDLTWKSFALISCFLEDEPRIIRIRINL